MSKVNVSRIEYALQQAYKRLKDTPEAKKHVDEGGVTLERLLCEARAEVVKLPPELEIEHDDRV
jgi:hypothetical protein